MNTKARALADRVKGAAVGHSAWLFPAPVGDMAQSLHIIDYGRAVYTSGEENVQENVQAFHVEANFTPQVNSLTLKIHE